MLDTIRNAWSWAGLDPTEIINTNSFGNLIVKDIDGVFWRICPEALTCEKIADDTDDFAKVWNDEEFQLDWKMLRMVAIAEKKIGALQQDRSYCFKLSPVVGGNYDADNLAEISLKELIAFSGNFAEQIKDVPDGGQIEIKLIP
jgi:hypothetical protein